tara:strand:- start:799 stop:2259 length:1461 start_codon:yes stop_codon:yes gene_type:complete
MKFNSVKINRRTVIKSIGASLGVAATASLYGCSDSSSVKPAVVTAEKKPLGIIGKDGKRVLPWSNWSGNLKAQPSIRAVPKNEQQLVDLIKNSKQTIRCVGAGHSWTPLVPTEDTLISLARFRGVKKVDSSTMEAEIGAGTLLSQIGEPLWQQGVSLRNMPDIDTQALAGAIATSTHGTGIGYGSLSSDVSKMTIVDAKGEVHNCSATQNSELYNAARNNLGCLGVVTSATLKVEKAYKLEEKSWVMPLEEALENAPELVTKNRNLEFFAFPYADYAVGLSLNEVPITTPDVEEVQQLEGENPLMTLRSLGDYTESFSWLRSFMLNRAISGIEPATRVNKSYRIFGNIRDIRFTEMEYSIPAESGPQCLKEILDTIKKHNIDVIFPIEYRYVKGDDVWLSPFYKRDTCSISCHNFHDRDYKKYFAAVEPIFLKYNGRPHWGKVHTLTAAEFSTKYSMLNEFLKVRKEYDPEGLFLNAHIKQILGVS